MRIEIENSSNVKALEFEAKAGGLGRLSMTFNSGVYDYDNVPEELFDTLCSVYQDGGSVGSAFNTLIRGKYEGRKRVDVADDG